jgi:hypothetical protein
MAVDEKKLVGFVLAFLVATCARSTPVATPASDLAPDGVPAEPSIVVTEALGSPHVGDVAPDFELPDQDGRTRIAPRPPSTPRS